MDYTEEELLAFIERHDEHEDYYRGQLAELRAQPVPVTVEDVARVLDPAIYPHINRLTGDGWQAARDGAEALLARFEITERKEQ